LEKIERTTYMGSTAPVRERTQVGQEPPYRQVPESGRPTIVQKDTFYPALATAWIWAG